MEEQKPEAGPSAEHEIVSGEEQKKHSWQLRPAVIHETVSGEEQGQPWYEIVRKREMTDLERQLKAWQDARPETVAELEKRKKQINAFNDYRLSAGSH